MFVLKQKLLCKIVHIRTQSECMNQIKTSNNPIQDVWGDYTFIEVTAFDYGQMFFKEQTNYLFILR